ncbi:MAG: response regulator transcription factor [Chromatiaceae bacterium]|nr:response regulator transcription factor [Chromatiaceae bacterium]
MSDKIRLLLADDHPLFRDGVSRTLAAERDMEVVAEFDDADAAVHAAADQLPDIAILDISMPGSGINAAKRIAQSCPVVKIVMLTVSEQDDDVIAALRAGARGYILKGISGRELVTIVRAIHQGDSYVSPDLAAKLLIEMQVKQGGTAEGDPLADLTSREEQILRGVARGLSNKEIGAELNIQEKTVKHYMTNILQKLQVRNRVEAALVARDHYRQAP